jgi:aldehyde dehydrogenase (NAD+)
MPCQIKQIGIHSRHTLSSSLSPTYCPTSVLTAQSAHDNMAVQMLRFSHHRVDPIRADLRGRAPRPAMSLPRSGETDGQQTMDVVPCVINGRAVPTSSSFEVLNPSTGKLLAMVARGGSAEIDEAVDAARAASRGWRRLSARDRAAHLHGVARILTEHAEELAALESQDTGKPLSQARADAAAAVRYFEFYANALETFFGDELPSLVDVVAFTDNVAFGVTAHIVPWNYPMQIACRTVAPAIAMGNCAVVKPAEDAPLTVVRIAQLATEAGLPAGILNVVPGFGVEAGAALAANPNIDHLSFTGSVAVGSAVAKAAAESVVPVLLELGGKSPNIVLPDADIKTALPTIAKSMLQNAGQTCSAGSRLLVHETVHDDVVDGLVRILQETRIGPGPADPDLGPLISARQLDHVIEMVADAASSSELRLGTPERSSAGYNGGYYFAPVVFDNVDPKSPIAQDEVFGPVVAVSTFRGLDEAVEIANGTDYGLIAAVWTTNVNSALRLSADIHAGQVYVNTYGAGGGVELPFGGFKKSGYGREKGYEALRAYCQTKTTIIKVAR